MKFLEVSCCSRAKQRQRNICLLAVLAMFLAVISPSSYS